MQIYIARNGERTGPYSLEEINRHLAAGTLSPVDQGWSEGSPGWKPILSFPGVIMPGGASSTTLPISTATIPHHAMIEYGGFWVRALAFMIDVIILAIPVGLVQIVLGSPPDDPTAGYPELALVVAILLPVIYFAVFWSSRMQASIGQRLFELKVVDNLTRERISFWRSLGRSIALWLGTIIFLIGVIPIAFTERKRGLHDIIAATYVVKETE